MSGDAPSPRPSSWRDRHRPGSKDIELGSLSASDPSSALAARSGGQNNNGFVDEGIGRESTPSNASSVEKVSLRFGCTL